MSSTLLVEAGAVLSFLLVWRQDTQAGRQTLLGGAFFGFSLEVLSVLLFDLYHYSDQFLLSIGPAPIAIGLLWGILLRGSQLISDAISGPLWQRAARDGVLIVLVDLSIDAVAIREGWWSWWLELDQGWYGVPYLNLIGWLWIGAGYGWLSRLIQRHHLPLRWTLLATAPAYLILLGGAIASQLLCLLMGWSGEEWRWAFACNAIGMIGLASWPGKRSPVAPTRALRPHLIVRGLIHCYALFWLLTHQGWQDLPLLTGLAAGLLGLEILLEPLLFTSTIKPSKARVS